MQSKREVKELGDEVLIIKKLKDQELNDFYLKLQTLEQSLVEKVKEFRLSEERRLENLTEIEHQKQYIQ